MPLYVDYVLLDDQLTKAFEHFEKALNWLYQGQEARHPDDDVPSPSDICFVRPYLRLMTRMLQSPTTAARKTERDWICQGTEENEEQQTTGRDVGGFQEKAK